MKHAIDDKLVMLAELTIKAEMLEAFLIPTCIDHNLLVHLRWPMVIMRQG